MSAQRDVVGEIRKLLEGEPDEDAVAFALYQCWRFGVGLLDVIGGQS